MKLKRYTEEQNNFEIRSMSQVLGSRDRLEDGNHRGYFFRSKKMYAGLGIADVYRLKQLEKES
ncbi:hypothetical protein [Gimesia chilikensis]|uniref:Uncharacterized protein n=1 Tax=Gimesia chilikensis TaxID=2605989 RepID=A0A517PPV4_9PLAN|nr:hypothetical protein HG66A1_31910 [Gimesia chilikensis]